MVKMENLRWGASDKLCTRYKNDSSCKHINMEIFSGGSQNGTNVHIYSKFIITLNNPYIGERSLSLGSRMQR